MPTTEQFKIDRKIIANMTTEGWQTIPHACFEVELDVTLLLGILKEVNSGKTHAEAITFNTAMVKIITEAMKKSPRMNSHLSFSNLFVQGKLTTFEHINVTMPVIIDREVMTTLNVKNVDELSMTGIRDSLNEMIRRAGNTHLPTVMYEVGIHDTMVKLRHLHVIKALGRLIGATLDGTMKRSLHGEEKRKYKAIPETERLTWKDLEQGTVTISNPGMLTKRWKSKCTLLDIIPPQVTAVAINRVDEKPVADKDGNIKVASTSTITVAFDHRALDGADFIAFTREIDIIMGSEERLRGLV